jgi:hypothetical protein
VLCRRFRAKLRKRFAHDLELPLDGRPQDNVPVEIGKALARGDPGVHLVGLARIPQQAFRITPQRPARIDAAMAQKVPSLRQIIAFRNVLITGYATSVQPASGGDRGQPATAARRAGGALAAAR